MRAPVDTIPAPPFPKDLPWVNVAPLRMDQQIGRPVLVEFWDFCQPHSLRTLPYVKAWHERYAGDGLRVIGVHTPGYEMGRDPAAAREAVALLGVEHAVALEGVPAVWNLYENEGWPVRYLFDQRLTLVDYHYGEGAYAETERAIQELLGVEREVLAPLRPEDDPEALIAVPTPDQSGPYSGPHGAGGGGAVLEGSGTFTVNGRPVAVEHPGGAPIVEHGRHTASVLDFEVCAG